MLIVIYLLVGIAYSLPFSVAPILSGALLASRKRHSITQIAKGTDFPLEDETPPFWLAKIGMPGDAAGVLISPNLLLTAVNH